VGVKSFDDIMNYLLPDIIQSGCPDPAVCAEVCPPDADLLAGIIESASPAGTIESQVLGHVMGVAAGLMAERGEALVVRQAQDYVGYQMSTEGAMICIEGDAGDFLGAFMSAGTILCQGSCRDFAFRGACGGTGLVVGDAGDCCAEELSGEAMARIMGSVGRSAGRRMHGGHLRIEGDAGEFFCRYMEGGTARVRDVELMGETYGGTITARRILQFEKGPGGTHLAKILIQERA